MFGGVAGLAFDPCYHQACDTFFNLSHVALDQMSDAAAHATWTLAESKSELAPATSAKAKKGKARQGLEVQGPVPRSLIAAPAQLNRGGAYGRPLVVLSESCRCASRRRS